MSEPWSVLCDAAELAVECARAAAELGLAVHPEVDPGALREATDRAARGDRVAVALSTLPDPAELVRLATAALQAERTIAVAVVAADDAIRMLARDLGLAAVSEIRPLAAVLAFLEVGADEPWAASTRQLPAVDRERVATAVGPGEQCRLSREDEGRLGFAEGDEPVRVVGEPRDVAEALRALREAHGASRMPMPAVEGLDPQTVLGVIFGPPRALSDPASKAALSLYDVPMPTEELCTSPSRAASEASRIGFPVRIALASPDLRVWAHPDLAADSVDNAARVRDVFRQVMALARARAPDARLLGVTVSATTPAHAALRLRATPLPGDLVLAEVGFADPHGLASQDRVLTVLPTPVERLEQALARLAGAPLLLSGSAAERRRTAEALSDVLLRVAAFVHDWRAQVVSVEIDPLALLVGGGVEVREACVEVGDAFVRSREAPGEQRLP